MIADFLELAKNVEADWRANDLNLEAFPVIATTHLETFPSLAKCDTLNQELSRWLATSNQVPEQLNVHNVFGQPPITLFNNGRFVVDLYIWMNFDTSIHSHGFRGAFRVIVGRSLQELFAVHENKTVASDVMHSSLGLPRREILKTGAVATIWPGKAFTHRVVHLDQPTITLCVRTINEEAASQWNHFQSGISIQKQITSPGTAKSLYFAQYLLSQNISQAHDFIKNILDNLSISQQMNLYEEVSFAAYDLNEECVNLLLHSISARHQNSPWFTLYEKHYENLENHIPSFLFTDPQQRLLAHLLNHHVETTEILSLLAQVHGTGHSNGDAENIAQSLLLSAHVSDNEYYQQIVKRFLSCLK